MPTIHLGSFWEEVMLVTSPYYAGITQLEEILTSNEKVGGSSPSASFLKGEYEKQKNKKTHKEFR